MLAPPPLLCGVLPPGVVAADALGLPPAGCLHPAEELVVAGAAPRRVRDFTGGRICAHRALAALGCPPGPLPRGDHGEPVWPRGVVGSLTHCDGYWAAAVTRRSGLAALGIDAEPHLPLPAGVAGQVLTPGERDRLAALPIGPHWDRLAFSAKESLYKAWFPLARTWLGFADAAVELRPDIPDDPGRGEVVVRLLRRPSPPRRFPTGLTGRYLIARGLIVTAVPVT